MYNKHSAFNTKNNVWEPLPYNLKIYFRNQCYQCFRLKNFSWGTKALANKKVLFAPVPATQKILFGNQCFRL